MTDYREVARSFVAQCMKARGMNRATLAKRADVDPKTIRSFLDGTRWPQAEKRAAISLAMHWDPDEIDWIAEHGKPRDMGGVRLLDLARENPSRLDDDDMPELMTTHRGQDERGQQFHKAVSFLADQPNGGVTRMEVTFWPSPEHDIRSAELMIVTADAHIAAISRSHPRMDVSYPSDTTDIAIAADHRESSIAGEQEESDTP